MWASPICIVSIDASGEASADADGPPNVGRMRIQSATIVPASIAMTTMLRTIRTRSVSRNRVFIVPSPSRGPARAAGRAARRHRAP